MAAEQPDKLALLQSMGVQVWLSRGTERPEAVIDAAAATSADSRTCGALDWDSLEAAVAGCRACELHRGRTQTVFGVGDHNARWMIIGEAPGAEEDRRGEPFVGRAGQLLNAMLLAAGFRRHEVYIANIVKCRPPENRDPRPDEAAACGSYLARQIELVQPQLILAVGRVAAQRLLQTDTPVGKMRGRLYRYGDNPGVPVVVTYHPAYLLRAPREKRKVWQDLLFALEQGGT